MIRAKDGFKDRLINPQSSFCCIFFTHSHILYGFISNRTMAILTVNSDFIRCAHAGHSELSAPEDVKQLVTACWAAPVWITMGSVQAAPDPGHWEWHISHHILYMTISRSSAVPVTPPQTPLCSHSVAQHNSLSKSADLS